MDLRIGPGICQELYRELLPCLLFVISDHLKDIYPLLNTVRYLGLPPSPLRNRLDHNGASCPWDLRVDQQSILHCSHSMKLIVID